MSQCPSLEWGKDARPRAEIPVLKWLLCLSLQRGILKASLCFSLSLSLPPASLPVSLPLPLFPRVGEGALVSLV